MTTFNNVCGHTITISNSCENKYKNLYGMPIKRSTIEMIVCRIPDHEHKKDKAVSDAVSSSISKEYKELCEIPKKYYKKGRDDMFTDMLITIRDNIKRLHPDWDMDKVGNLLCELTMM